MGVWVEMSGQGCRAFETLSTLKNCWQDIFWFIFKEGCNVTRLDIAYDDHVGILDLGVIKQDTESGEYISKATYWEVVNSSKGLTVQIGSSKSPVLIRMYDKARERNCEPGTHWVRQKSVSMKSRVLSITWSVATTMLLIKLEMLWMLTYSVSA